MGIFGRICLVLVALVMAACDHPIQIAGQGDVLSASGERTCLLEEFQAGQDNCKKNTVVGEYNETYFAQPRTGWKFARWENYCTDATVNECAFAVPGSAVFKAWGLAAPPLVAVFTPTNVTEPDWALEGSNASYAATRVLQSDAGTITAKEYATVDKHRLEIEQAGQKLAFINREDLQVTWLLYLSQNFYSEVDTAQFDEQSGDDLEVLEYSKVGTETLNGIVTDKYRVVVEDADGNRGEGFYWVSRSGILVRMEMVIDDGEQERSFTMYLTNLVEGPQPASLFEIPANFTKLPGLPTIPGLPTVPGVPTIPGLPAI
jgi:hypothetical protein